MNHDLPKMKIDPRSTQNPILIGTARTFYTQTKRNGYFNNFEQNCIKSNEITFAPFRNKQLTWEDVYDVTKQRADYQKRKEFGKARALHKFLYTRTPNSITHDCAAIFVFDDDVMQLGCTTVRLK